MNDIALYFFFTFPLSSFGVKILIASQTELGSSLYVLSLCKSGICCFLTPYENHRRSPRGWVCSVGRSTPEQLSLSEISSLLCHPPRLATLSQLDQWGHCPGPPWPRPPQLLSLEPPPWSPLQPPECLLPKVKLRSAVSPSAISTLPFCCALLSRRRTWVSCVSASVHADC